MPVINLHRSWHDSDMAPERYLAVYVGPSRTQFVIKTESVNQRLFRLLLEEAGKEYGFLCSGPLILPYDVAVFRIILEALSKDCDGEDSMQEDNVHLGLFGGCALDIFK